MAGIDDILNIIETQQKQTEQSIISAAERKAAAIKKDGDEKALRAYEDYMKRAGEQADRDFENACKSADAEMKRRILACKVRCIDSVIDKTVEKLRNLPDEEYFALLEKLAVKLIRKGDGVISLSGKDLKRVTKDFEKNLNESAKKKNGSIKLSDVPADIDDGFVLSYGLISENCSFRAVMEADKDSVRDTAAKVLFG
ncbi:MAG: H(+)-transporting ATPase [Ruminococcus sp.]|nr:H(+)-transporting ATPase [Ruminococcus sp.]